MIVGYQGIVVGVLAGAGLGCVWWSCWPRPERTERQAGRARRALGAMVTAAGMRRLTVRRFLLLVTATVLVGTLLGTVVMRSSVVGACFGLLAGLVPFQVLASSASRRQVRLEAAWPDVVDHLTSAVRAGVSLPEAISAVSERGPLELRPAFAAFASDYRSTGNCQVSLDRLGDRLADPVADRIIATLQLARDVGGSELGSLLRGLAEFLRDEMRVRGEARARQSWTVTGARMAACAPWVVLALLSTRTDALRAFNSAAGIAVLAGGAGATVIAYAAMVHISRLPSERRLGT